MAPCSPVRSPPYRAQYNHSQMVDSDDKGPNMTVPRSPRTPVTRGMCHYIAHRFTKTFKMIATCDYCEKQMFLGAGLRCKECKYKCHRDCESKVPPSCGLSPELIEEFKKQLHREKISDGDYVFIFLNDFGKLFKPFCLSGQIFHLTSSPVTGRSPQHPGNSIVPSYRPRKKSHHTLNPYTPSFPVCVIC
jgi:hypothetical protein